MFDADHDPLAHTLAHARDRAARFTQWPRHLRAGNLTIADAKGVSPPLTTTDGGASCR